LAAGHIGEVVGGIVVEEGHLDEKSANA